MKEVLLESVPSWSILSCTVLVLVYIYFKKCHNYWKDNNVSQLSPIFPFGDMASVIFRRQNMGDKIKDIYNQMKGHRYVGLYFFSRKALLPLDPVLIQDILSKDFQYFQDRGIYYDEKNDPLSAHLFSLSGNKWKTLRSKLTPAYSPVKLKFMFSTILDCGYHMMDYLKEQSNIHGTIEIREVLARFTTDVIGSCAFGLECNSMKDPDAEFRIMGKRAFTQTVGDVLKMIIIRSFPSMARMMGIGVFSGTVTNFFQKVVEDTIYYRENNNIIRKDFLQLLIQLKNNESLTDDKGDNENSLSMDEIAAQAFIFFLAGFETTSTTTSFALYEMSINDDIQGRARREFLDLLEKYNGHITYDLLMELKYIETIILETLRKYPPAPVFLRKCTKSYKIPETDVIIEKGTSVLIPAYGLHRDPEYFPEPEKFDPERFNEENKHNIASNTYIPFGDGPRVCIGMRFAMIQIKIAIVLAIKSFDISLSKKTIVPLNMEKKGIILAPIGGLWLEFKPRIS